MSSFEIHLTEKQDNFLSQQLSQGCYKTKDAVISAALELLEREEQNDSEKLEWLRAAIAEGDASGIARGNVIAQVKRESRILARGR